MTDRPVSPIRRRRRRPRLSSTQRGYDATHRRTRRKVAEQVNRGGVPCVRCRRPIIAGQRWELDHLDGAAAKALHAYRGPAHTACNRRAGALKKQGRAFTPPAPRRPAPALAFFDV